MFYPGQQRDSFFAMFSFLSVLARAGCLPRVTWTGCRRMGNFTSSPALSSTSCVQYVKEMVSQNCVVIFSKTTCPYCKMAKNVFNEIGATYKAVELDEHNDGRGVQEALAQITGARTVPRVFINGKCIGGGSDTKQLYQQGKLLPLIEQCAPGSGSGQFETAR
ncbi:glutaredoxin 2 isoform X1 [Pseudoliparis swirei]|uniref:glutaredoxin 2 isoform X1 n=1 Tax=Pseudoliparis swirei TaxID=2059687 RepID=UPI0024BEC04A|nr:glutaredoxin 2 isoform X1 [Pseudoliparis swirei]